MNNSVTFSKLGSYGHLGNQLFQFSLLYSYSKVKNKNIKFLNDNKNSMLFKCFDIKCDINFLDNIIINSTYTERKFSYDSEVWNKNVDNFIGYFQSEKYFKNNEELKNIFSFKTKSDALNDHVFIHVRRGDYLKYPNIHPVCSEDYYSNSIDLIKNKYGSSVKFTVFSDNIIETQTYNCFKQNNIEFSNDSSFISLYKMTTCMSGIIANSSFSWWGAWLMVNINKTIIAPKNWFGSSGPKDTQDLYCSDWIVL